MFRLLCCVVAIGVLALQVPAADDAVELKNYKSKVGERVRVTDDERNTMRSIIIVGDKREEKLEKHNKLVVYVSETLAVKEGEKKATKMKRVYEKAESVKDDTVSKEPLHGKTVIIEKKGEKYTFTSDDGKALDGKPREELDKEFNKKDDDDIDDFIPKRPLKPGETWKMDADKLIKSLAKDTDAFSVDKKGASGNGKLAEVYSFGGKKYGVYDMRMEFPLIELGGADKIPLKAGSKMAMHVIGDGNVDGTEPDGILTIRITMRVYFDTNGVQGSIKSDGVVIRSTEKLPGRPRD